MATQIQPPRPRTRHRPSLVFNAIRSKTLREMGCGLHKWHRRANCRRVLRVNETSISISPFNHSGWSAQDCVKIDVDLQRSQDARPPNRFYCAMPRPFELHGLRVLEPDPAWFVGMSPAAPSSWPSSTDIPSPQIWRCATYQQSWNIHG